MIQKYNIQGMTCNGCVAKVKQSLERLDGVEKADIQLVEPQGKLTLNHSVPLPVLQEAIGRYRIKTVAEPTPAPQLPAELPEKSLTTYRPLLFILGYITGVSLLVQYPFDQFSGMLWMRHFMAGFFLTFSFFKLLNLQGFATSYQMYDIIATKWKGWAYLYPFIELGLGLLYLLNIAPIITNWITLVILGLSSIGVIRSVLDKRKIKCACLGSVFNLPMSTVTIVEDLTMVAMAGLMLLYA